MLARSLPARPLRLFLNIAVLRDGCRRPLLKLSTRHGNPVRTLTLKGVLRGRSPQKGAAEIMARPQGKAFPP